MIQIKDKSKCCGCNACVLICPEKCIVMKEDREGFLYPEVQLEKCTDCGLCEKICPLLKETTLSAERLKSPHVSAAWNKEREIRINSTSGGIFSVLAEKMLESNGFIAGAVYSEDHTVVHIVTNDKLKLDKIRGSKYAQSYAGDLYTNVKHLLDSGEKVLVCAAPCQINALYSIIGKDHPNLITCDFICRGVGSPKVFLKCMDLLEQEYGAHATKIVQKNN